MPRVRTDHPDARAYLIEHAQYWLKLGCDGFRLDHAQGATHAFWSAFRSATRNSKPDSVTFGEIIEPPTLQRSFVGRMDGCLDFLLYQALHNFFCSKSITASQFNAFVRRHHNYFPANYVQPSFLDNHDMNRFLWKVGGDKRRLRLASLCLFTAPGPPIIYYGTEVGLSQYRRVGRMEEARLPMLWDDGQDQELLSFYKKLIALRRDGGAVWRGPRQTLVIDDDRNIYAYVLGPCAVVLNNCPKQNIVSLPGWQRAKLALATEADVSWKAGRGELTLAPYAGVCLFRG